MGHRDLLVTQNLSQPTSNHRSGRLTRSVRRAGGFVQVGLPDISNNVGPVKLFLSALLRSLRRVVFVVSFDLCFDDHGSLVSLDRFRSDLNISSINTSTTITSSDSLRREWDAQSSGRRPTARHVRYRAVPRTNRTLATASTHNHSATSSTVAPPVAAPSQPWRCSCVYASPGAHSDASTLGCYVPPPGPLPPTRIAAVNFLAC